MPCSGGAGYVREKPGQQQTRIKLASLKDEENAKGVIQMSLHEIK
jgi:hypothetical protein